jgi:oxygen-independent coproporphyrinogen-3 oxidase
VALSIYVHIPYCLQRCRYCDFTTFQQSEILPPEKYVAQVHAEIENRHQRWLERDVHTIYFGGGTPSLLSSDLIISILDRLANVGFRWTSNSEITIEINPATMDEKKLDAYLAAGINRFSVGAQSFDDRLLSSCGRKHNAQDTRDTLRILKSRNLNYSFDLLFALPNQSLSQLRCDLEEVCEFQPPHLSAYCLTVPEGHPMSRGRAPEDEQVEMFQLIESRLQTIGLEKYEISNFAKPGFESKHNLVYWNDQNYWGIGVSAHSYDRNAGPFGERFWNTKDIFQYGRQSASANLPSEQNERLLQHEAMTDFCHMFLRTRTGLERAAARNKFGAAEGGLICSEIENLLADGLLEEFQSRVRLTPQGELISNQVFERLTFLPPRSSLTEAKSNPYLA